MSNTEAPTAAVPNRGIRRWGGSLGGDGKRNEAIAGVPCAKRRSRLLEFEREYNRDGGSGASLRVCSGNEAQLTGFRESIRKKVIAHSFADSTSKRDFGGSRRPVENSHKIAMTGDCP